MKNKSLLLAAAFISTIGIYAQDNWIIDKSHSSISFAVDHLVVSEVIGSFNTFSGAMAMNGEDISTAKISGTVEVKSVDTKNSQRDNNLVSSEFFDSATYPEIKFESTSIKKIKDNSYLMKGNLTMKNVTKPVEFELIYKGTVTFMRQIKTGIKAVGKINRKDYGLSYSMLLEGGGAVIGNEVTINLNLEFVKQ